MRSACAHSWRLLSRLPIDQVHIHKAAGGKLPLAMSEESLKSIEGPATRRRVQARMRLDVGQIYAPANLAGEVGFHAAAESLYTDCLVFEGSQRHGMPLSRFAADYEKFFNTLARPA